MTTHCAGCTAASKSSGAPNAWRGHYRRADADWHALGALPSGNAAPGHRPVPARSRKDCLVSFEASLYSRAHRPGPDGPTGGGPRRRGDHHPADNCPRHHHVLAVQARATRRGSWMIDQAHWDGVPTVTPAAARTSSPTRPPRQGRPANAAGALSALLTTHGRRLRRGRTGRWRSTTPKSPHHHDHPDDSGGQRRE
jgi:hypothetical protein